MSNVIERLEALAALDWEATDADEYAIRAALPDLLKLARALTEIRDYCNRMLERDEQNRTLRDIAAWACAALEPLFREEQP